MPEARDSLDDAALAEDVDLELETRKRVLALHTDLGKRDHYALLGVSQDADKRAIKKAYYELAGTFHPDRYFRKRLGSFKPRMELIFARVTLAHDVLSDPQKRAEYDAYLAEQRRARSIEDLMADALAEIQRAEASIAREAQEGPAPIPPPAPAPTAPAPPPRPMVPTTPALTDAARREALARRLLGGRHIPASARPPSQPPARIPSAAEAVGALRRRYEERIRQAKASAAKRYVDAAETAASAGDVVAVANSLRVALGLMPEDAALAERVRQAQLKADEVLAETYSRQAAYEEKNGQWPEAARSWARVCRARPDDARAHDQAANALVKAEGDTHEAGRLAQRACILEPTNARYRLTLATVYQAAGLGLNARRELETAAQLAPQDDTIQAMLKRVGKPV